MITWNIAQLERSLPSGMVTTVHWTVSLVDEEYSASSYGSIGLPAKEPEDPTFVNFEDITKEQAIEWLKDAMGEEQVANIEAGLESQIEAQKNPTSASGLPWSSSTVD
jgi:hypothetical protein